MQSPANSQYTIDQCVFYSSISSQDSCSVFEKYRTGFVSTFSAFRLYSTDVSFEEDSEDSINQKNNVRGAYRKYTLQQKQLAVSKILNGYDVKQISKQYGIPRRNLLRWRKNGCERKQGGGRPTDYEMQCILYDKIKKQQIKGEKEIRSAAIEVSKSQNFKASKGWFSKFCRRYKLKTGLDLLRA